MEPKISHHGRKQLDIGEGVSRWHKYRQEHGRGLGIGRLQVPLREEILQVWVDTIRGWEMGRWQQELR